MYIYMFIHLLVDTQLLLPYMLFQRIIVLTGTETWQLIFYMFVTVTEIKDLFYPT